MNFQAWMKDIDDSKSVFELNMAGTHDCVTQYVQFSYISRCQDKNIYEQLCLGIRALDIRCEVNGDRLKMVHGIAKAFVKQNHFSAQMDMEDVLEHCYKFLKKNNSETIVFQFKNDSGKNQEKAFDILLNNYISKNTDMWYLKNKAPLLREVRGKIILVRRCAKYCGSEYGNNTGIDFSSWIEQDDAKPDAHLLSTGGKHNMDFIIQDRYKYKPKPRWSKCIKPFLDKSKAFDGTYKINYLSTAGGLKGPYNNAKYINRKFLEYPLEHSKYYGIIYADFPSEALAEKIIKTN